MTTASSSDFALLQPSEVEEIAARAWQNVSAYSAEYTPLSMLASLSDLQALPEEQLEYRTRLQFLLSDELRAFIRSASGILVRLAQTTKAQISEGRSPIGNIDWPATLLRRLSSGRDPSTFVLRRTEVNRDLPENRLLKFLLGEAVRLAKEVSGARPDSEWRLELETLRARAEKLEQKEILRTLPAEFGRQGYLAAKSSRVPGYRELARAYELYDGLFRRGDHNRLIDLFSQRVLVPRAEERAFELLVLFRVVEHFQAKGARRSSVRLIGRGGGPRFTFETTDHTVDVYFQNLPEWLARRSLYHKFMTATALEPGTRRPDIVIQFSNSGSVEQTVLIEAKCSTALDTIRDGGFQLVGYLSDFKLYEEVDTILLLVAYGGVPRYVAWPGAVAVPPFRGLVSDIDGLSSVLAVMPI